VNKKALIAMSGGVDSSVAAFLTKRQGFECIGASMKLFDNEDIWPAGEKNKADSKISGGDNYGQNITANNIASIGKSDITTGAEKSCCSLLDTQDARSVAHRLDMPFYVFNLSREFKKQIINRFIASYQNGETPNPCIDCNRFMKFEILLARAKTLQMDYIVTGHYAKIEYDGGTGRYLLKKGADTSKDQSYVLYAMTQEQLKHTLFPLGEMTKSEIRKIAAGQGFVNADKRDSQDICFVRDGGYADFIEKYTGKKCKDGNFVDMHGKVLGRHKGLIRYTIGQRHGLGLSMPHPSYVVDLRPGENAVVVGKHEQLFSTSLQVEDINLIPFDRLDAPLRAVVKIRYADPGHAATVHQENESTLRIEFDEPQRAVTKGQSAVFYVGDTVIGGGIIR